MTEIKGKDAQRIKNMAHKFDETFSEAFIDMPMRAAIWSEPGNDNLILIKVLCSNEKGNFVSFLGQYQVDIGEFFYKGKSGKIFIDGAHEDKAVEALVEFISSITQMKFAINKVLLDLNVMRYYSVKIGKSQIEEGCVNVHICTYLDQAKDDYGFVDAKDVVGEELASF